MIYFSFNVPKWIGNWTKNEVTDHSDIFALHINPINSWNGTSLLIFARTFITGYGHDVNDVGVFRFKFNGIGLPSY